jgi:2-oxoglutarate ferredoxin oxidoreductase subunit beta
VKKVYARPRLLKEAHFHYCPGCGHAIVTRLLAEVVEEMKLGGKAICVAPAGCGMLVYNYFDFDTLESAHGRGAAVATGIKRVRPENLVFSYQGDGDLAAIGTAESFHAANRGEPISVIFVNNGVYGMTGGQMAPTSLLDQVTTTSPLGRTSKGEGHPVKMCEVLALLPGTSYLERVAVNKPAAILKAKKAIAKSFEHQLRRTGFSMVEILSPCPTNWKMSPLEACTWLEEVMAAEFPLGIVKEVPC